MTALAARRARLRASLYVSFGEPATWTPAGGGGSTPVTIRRVPDEEIGNFTDARVLLTSILFKVRVSDLVQADDGARVVVNPGPDQEELRVIAEPRLERFGGEWVCEAARV